MVEEYKKKLTCARENARILHAALPHRQAIAYNEHLTLEQKMIKLMNFNFGFGLPVPVPVFDNRNQIARVDYIQAGPPQTIIANTTDSDSDLIDAAAHSYLHLDTPFEWDLEEEEDTDEDDFSEDDSGKSGDTDGGEDENSETTL
jgi:hypothetical protein